MPTGGRDESSDPFVVGRKGEWKRRMEEMTTTDKTGANADKADAAEQVGQAGLIDRGEGRRVRSNLLNVGRSALYSGACREVPRLSKHYGADLSTSHHQGVPFT
jgi:hypothetical protein